MASEPSWGPSIGNRPLKWTEIGPTNDPWMISDEFETFDDKKIFIVKIQNIHFLKKDRIVHSYRHSILFDTVKTPRHSAYEILDDRDSLPWLGGNYSRLQQIPLITFERLDTGRCPAAPPRTTALPLGTIEPMFSQGSPSIIRFGIGGTDFVANY